MGEINPNDNQVKLTSSKKPQFFLYGRKKDTVTGGTSSNVRQIKPLPKLQGLRDIGTDSELATNQDKVQISQIRDYINENKVNLSDVLSKSLKDSRFVFIGESHIEGLESWKGIVGSFERLKKEAEARGEKLIVAIELPEGHQQAAANAPVDALENLISASGASKETDMWEVLFGARRAGLEVHCVDPGIPGFEFGNSRNKAPTIQEFREREGKLFTNLESLIKPNTKILYYGGWAHGSVTPVKNYPGGRASGDLVSVGTRLTQKYGQGSITSIGMVNREIGFDGNPQPISKTPKVSDVWRSSDGVAIVPTGGQVPYSERTSHHYVMIDPSSPK